MRSCLETPPGEVESQQGLCVYFFFALSTLSVFFTIFPSITTPLPSRKAMRERPSQFLNVSTTRGCCGAKFTSAISLDLSECSSTEKACSSLLRSVEPTACALAWMSIP